MLYAQYFTQHYISGYKHVISLLFIYLYLRSGLYNYITLLLQG